MKAPIFPVMKLGDIILREIQEKDAQGYYEYMTHPEVKKFLSGDDTPKDLEHAAKELSYWRRLHPAGISCYWAIVNQSGNIIGTCGYNHWAKTHRRLELSYDLNHEYWNKGITTRALMAICEYAYKMLNVNRIQATVACNNFASIRVLEKLGLQKEGVMKDYGILLGKPYDYYMYGVTKNEFK